MVELIVKPTTRKHAKEICLQHPHARTLPNSSKYHFIALINGEIKGLAAWGFGVTPRHSFHKLFSHGNHRTDYLELCRYFTFEGTPPHYESKFLATTIRLLFKYLPKLKCVYTYAAGFQGMLGIIYQACGFDYIGKQELNALYYLEGIGLIHRVAVNHRYRGKGCDKRFKKQHPNWNKIFGYNFKYIKFRDQQTKDEMMKHAKFEILPYPTQDEIKIWDLHGKTYTKEEMAKIPIIKLPTSI